MGINKHVSTVRHATLSRRWNKRREFNPNEIYGPGIDLNQIEICDDEHWSFTWSDSEGALSNQAPPSQLAATSPALLQTPTRV
ncbi:Ribonuclease H [Emericellopsis cladophorae]|uniref:Ribonuclease H n=1 Tax=Emericellopsis cladophorae TaxID=2686198 RepID=A0A9Q0BB25_9HYPO|nr:Ribonuclease H [Emericellopsis cladophorae]KAI6777604.1 Ribonuclease H [Emericellopsis cladophorae]